MGHSVDNNPFAEAPWLMGVPSPYYSDSHRRWQKTCREFVWKNLGQYGLQWTRQQSCEPEVYQTFADAPCLPAPLPIARLKALGIRELAGSLKLEEYDYFHYLIYMSEVW